VQLAHKVSKDPLALKDLLVLKEHRAFKVSQVLLDRLAQLVIQALDIVSKANTAVDILTTTLVMLCPTKEVLMSAMQVEGFRESTLQILNTGK
jgi:acetolactate synthase regulatory subunit